MSGLDVAAGAAGFASLCVTLVNGCIQGIAIIAATRDAHKEIDRLSFIFEWEQSRLLRWAQKAGLFHEDMPSAKLNWALVHELLKRLHTELTDATILQEKYNLVVVPQARNNGDEPNLVQLGHGQPSRKTDLFGNLWTCMGSRLRHYRDQVSRGSTTGLRKVRWVTLDQDKAKAFLTNIGYYINALHELLDDEHQANLRMGMELLVRNLVSRSSNATDLATIRACLSGPAITNVPALEAASNIKQIRLMLGIDSRPDEVRSGPQDGPRPKVKRVKYSHLTNFETVEDRPDWQLSNYRTSSSIGTVQSRVLLEWKHATIKRSGQMIKHRITELALLMSSCPAETFHVLTCLGFTEVVDEHRSSFAYVFEVHSINQASDSLRSSRILSLAVAMKLHNVPSLTWRVGVALQLAQTVLQMHTAGWLHKGIRAENVMFVTDERIASPGLSERVSGPFLAGFEFTRGSLEETETMPTSSNQRLYESSERRSLSSQHQSFKRRHDLHALGCVLIELFLWIGLPHVLELVIASSSTPQADFARSANQVQYEMLERLWEQRAALDTLSTATPILDRVSAAGGDRARKVVEMCLFAPTQPSSPANGEGHEGSEADEIDLSIDIQVSVVRMLQAMHEHL